MVTLYFISAAVIPIEIKNLSLNILLHKLELNRTSFIAL